MILSQNTVDGYCYDFVTKTGSYKISTGFCDKTLYAVYLPVFVTKPYM